MLGGSPYNVAIGLARLGSKTAFVSRISADGNGEALAAGLAGNGVDLALVVRDKRPSTLAFVMRGTAKTGSRYSSISMRPPSTDRGRFRRVAQRRAPPACWLHFGDRPAAWRTRGRSAECHAPARDRKLRSQHPTVGDPIGRPSRRLSSGRPRSRMWSRRARKTCNGFTRTVP